MTKQDLLDLHPCRDGLEFAASCEFDFVKIWNTCERGDWLIWLLLKTGNITKPQAVEISIVCALHVIEKFEAKHPDDKRPRKAIEAAQAWLTDPSDKNKKAAADAAAAAYAAAAADVYDAAAAYAAAAAADAAAADADVYAAAAAAVYDAAAVYAAAAAAADAAAAAAAAAAADADARATERKWQADKIRELVKCPF